MRDDMTNPYQNTTTARLIADLIRDLAHKKTQAEIASEAGFPKAITASLQRHIVEQQCALYAPFRRHCQGCGGTRPIKDYSTRTIRTVHGAVTGRARGCTPAAAACPVLISQ